MNYVVIYATLCKAFESTAFSLMLTLTCFKGYNLLMKNLNECDALLSGHRQHAGSRLIHPWEVAVGRMLLTHIIAFVHRGSRDVSETTCRKGLNVESREASSLIVTQHSVATEVNERLHASCLKAKGGPWRPRRVVVEVAMEEEVVVVEVAMEEEVVVVVVQICSVLWHLWMHLFCHVFQLGSFRPSTALLTPRIKLMLKDTRLTSWRLLKLCSCILYAPNIDISLLEKKL
ncbi:uncharacterized protein [Physcomitrium patens]|uniref:uncharacterized protein isoform X1 n=1 Tax=Physcomitrium patens TaxID=3218 RepID=UPI003CCCBB43